MVRELWEQRKKQRQQNHFPLDDDDDYIKKKLVEFKHPSDSRTTMDYNFTDCSYLKEAYQSPCGTMRLGRVLEDLDALAGNVASQQIAGYYGGRDNDNTTTPVMLVTAAVDRIVLEKNNIPDLQYNQRLSSQSYFSLKRNLDLKGKDDGENKLLFEGINKSTPETINSDENEF